MNLRKLFWAAGLMFLLPGVALAGKAATLHVKESVEINAEPSAVWAVVKDWNGMHTWHPAFSNTEIKSGANNKIGSLRTLTLKDGGAKFDEELLAYKPKKMYFKYRILGDSPFPLTNYVSSIKVKGGKKPGTSVLIWEGSFKRKAVDNPPPGQDDAGVKKTISGAYQAGLNNVKTMIGK
jgi:mxaD protein